MSTEAYKIKQVRRAILEALNMTYPSSQRLDSLFRIILGVDPTYDRAIFAKDITYLIDKGYIKFVESPVLPQTFDKRLARLTPEGKEIADRTMTDRALEI